MIALTVEIIGDGSEDNPRRPDLKRYESWVDNGDGTAAVTITPENSRQAKSDAVKAANALNIGTTWSDVEAVFGDDPLLPAVKKWLAQGADSDGPVKKQYSGFSGPVPQGFVVSHDAALWRATTETSAEPLTTSDDWTLIFEV